MAEERLAPVPAGRLEVQMVGGPLDGAEGAAPPADTSDGRPERIVLEGHDGWYAPSPADPDVYVWVAVS